MQVLPLPFAEILLTWLPAIAAAAAAALLAAAAVLAYLLVFYRHLYDGRRFNDVTMGFGDLLIWDRFIDNGVVLNKDGSLTAAWYFQGPDASTLDATQRNYLSWRLNNLLASLGSGYMIHTDVVRRELPAYVDRRRCFFADPVSRACDEERRHYFTASGQLYNSMQAVALTFRPMLIRGRQAADYFMAGGAGRRTARQVEQEILCDFQRKCERFEDALRGMLPAQSVVRMQALRGEDAHGRPQLTDLLAGYLYQTAYGRTREIVRSRDCDEVAAIIGGADLHVGMQLLLGRTYIAVVAVEGLTGSTQPQMLEVLSQLSCEYRLSMRCIIMDRAEATALVSRKRRYWQQKRRGLVSVLLNRPPTTVNLDAEEMIAQADYMQREVDQGSVCFCFFNCNLIFYDRDPARLQQGIDQARAVLAALGLVAREESLNTIEAYLGSLPGHGGENLRNVIFSSYNAADLFPLSTLWQGSRECPCSLYPAGSPALAQCLTGPGWNVPFYLNLFQRDLGHALIFGPSGSGKSTLLCFLVLSYLRYRGMRVVCFDKGRSMYALTHAVGGCHYVPGGEGSELCFCPLEALSEGSGGEIFLTWWLESLLQLGGLREVTVEMGEQIRRAVANLSELRAQGGQVQANLSELRMAVQDPLVQEVLTQFTSDGPLGELLDSRHDDLDLSGGRLWCFEIEELMGLSDKYRFPVLTYLFHRIENLADGTPMVIVLDEAWVMLGHPLFRDKIREWLKVLRKANVSVIMATQSLSDVTASGIMDVLIENTGSKIFLPNPAARQEEASQLYAAMGLNGAQIALLSQMEQKREYLIKTGDAVQKFQLALGEVQRLLCCVSDKQSLRRIDELRHSHGESWFEAWCALHGADLQGCSQAAEGSLT